MPTLQNEHLSVSARTVGAELTSIKGANGLEYLWQGDPAFWAKQSPLLFPIVGNLPDKEFTHLGKTYPMNNHGFISTREFKLAQSSATEMIFEFHSDETSKAIYPFEYKLEVRYTLVGQGLSVGYKVSNLGQEILPFSIGAHPAFRTPLDTHESRSDMDLIFEKSENVRRHILKANNTAGGETEIFLKNQTHLPVTAELFEKGAIVLKDHVSRKVMLKSRKSGHFVELSFSGFPYLGIWSPKGETPFVCLEPWYGVMPQDGSDKNILNKEGIQKLAVGGIFKAEYQINVG